MTDQCAPGKHCVNLERVKGELLAHREAANGETRLLASKIEDLRQALVELPQNLSDAMRREREEVTGRMERGSSLFRKLFDRMGRLERAVLAVWIVVGFIGLGKAAAVIWPFVSKLVGG